MFGIGMMASADFGKFHYAGLAIAISLAIGLVAVMTLATSLLCLAGRWAFWPIMPETGRVPGTSGADRAQAACDLGKSRKYPGTLARGYLVA